MKKTLLMPLIALVLAMLACTPVTVTVNGEPIGDRDADSSEVVRGDTVQTADLQTTFDTLPAGDPASGEQLYNARPCHTCHSDMPICPVFPGSPALADRAETRKAGYGAELYLYESIMSPTVYVVTGFDGDVMPNGFGEELSAQDAADLVAYLMTMD